MKTKLKRLLAIVVLALLSSCIISCVSKRDTEFMQNSSAAIHGGYITTPEGTAFSMGQQTPDVHPFFGAPASAPLYYTPRPSYK
jgi:hypothetical protein